MEGEVAVAGGEGRVVGRGKAVADAQDRHGRVGEQRAEAGGDASQVVEDDGLPAAGKLG